MKKYFLKGLAHGIPIALGYFSVSFGFGIFAVKSGLSAFVATMISLTNVTSAGQVAGVTVIAALGGILEIVLTQLTINLRYSLMALSLSQKLHPSFTTGKRLIASFGITDEIFAVASAQKELLRPAYMYGLISISVVGWVLGTFLGAVAGELLPKIVSEALGLMLYGMFVAIIVPPARKERPVLFVVIIAAGISMIFYYLLPMVSFGFAVIISAVVSSAVIAFFFPKAEESEAQE